MDFRRLPPLREQLPDLFPLSKSTPYHPRRQEDHQLYMHDLSIHKLTINTATQHPTPQDPSPQHSSPCSLSEDNYDTPSPILNPERWASTFNSRAPEYEDKFSTRSKKRSAKARVKTAIQQRKSQVRALPNASNAGQSTQSQEEGQKGKEEKREKETYRREDHKLLIRAISACPNAMGRSIKKLSKGNQKNSQANGGVTMTFEKLDGLTKGLRLMQEVILECAHFIREAEGPKSTLHHEILRLEYFMRGEFNASDTKRQRWLRRQIWLDESEQSGDPDDSDDSK